MYKMIVVDLDGTLLNDAKQVSKENINLIKIAMANAEEYLKEKADYITTSNNESGVAKAIAKFVFNEE